MQCFSCRTGERYAYWFNGMVWVDCPVCGEEIGIWTFTEARKLGVRRKDIAGKSGREKKVAKTTQGALFGVGGELKNSEVEQRVQGTRGYFRWQAKKKKEAQEEVPQTDLFGKSDS